jgi:hypothetical protein
VIGQDLDHPPLLLAESGLQLVDSMLGTIGPGALRFRLLLCALGTTVAGQGGGPRAIAAGVRSV